MDHSLDSRSSFYLCASVRLCCCCPAAKLSPTLCSSTGCSTAAPLPSATPWSCLRVMSLSRWRWLSLLPKPKFMRLLLFTTVMPSNHLVLYRPLLLLLPVFPSIRFFSSESAHLIRWSSASASILPHFIFLGFKINMDSDCSHEIKRHSLEE